MIFMINRIIAEGQKISVSALKEMPMKLISAKTGKILNAETKIFPEF